MLLFGTIFYSLGNLHYILFIRELGSSFPQPLFINGLLNQSIVYEAVVGYYYKMSILLNIQLL
ncbi:unnamed protein product [Musa acuminata subsp. malaccensis]|uniref:Uncharacterized protein n=1 Tax=Musa acuminata subsp. malaccensis TaxID=214687 RepID=A0A804U5L6_MUSAM|nr:unnamed protein product [Musa acuminata subsp. malaccensis]